MAVIILTFISWAGGQVLQCYILAFLVFMGT